MIAAFDFDGTLIKSDSFLMFIRHALPFFKIAKGILISTPTLIKWKLGIVDSTLAKQCLFRNLFGGMSFHKLQAKAESFASCLDGKLNHETMRVLNRLQNEGARIVIVSASLGLWLQPWAKRHGVDTVLSTEAEVKDGRLTGRFSNANCKGSEKIRRLVEIFPERNKYWLEAWGDSTDDLPLLKFADRGHRVRK